MEVILKEPPCIFREAKVYFKVVRDLSAASDFFEAFNILLIASYNGFSLRAVSHLLVVCFQVATTVKCKYFLPSGTQDAHHFTFT